jgi:hypothetical protein
MSVTKEERVRYALAKQVPAMRTEVTLHTSYGEFTLYEEDAARVAAVVEKIMQRKLKQLEKRVR